MKKNNSVQDSKFRKQTVLDSKIRLVARQGQGQTTFCHEVSLADIRASQTVQDRKAFVVYGD